MSVLLMRRLLLAGAVLVAAGELTARMVLGLGTPPLYQTDPELEYVLQPGQDLYRFGNLFQTNERGMRSPGLIGESRSLQLAVEDSVPFGGAQVDQAQLATTLLSDESRVFGNLSAQSWGPANIEAARRRNNDLKPETVLLVLNREDLTDLPTFAPLNNTTHPEKAPALALQEVIMRYLPRYLPMQAFAAINHDPAKSTLEKGENATRALFSYVSELPADICVVLHPTKAEVTEGLSEELRKIRDLAAEQNLQVIDASADYRKASSGQDALYLDYIHLTGEGRKALAAAMLRCLTTA